MSSKLKYILDPLDREVLDRAFDEAWAAVHAKANALIENQTAMRNWQRYFVAN